MRAILFTILAFLSVNAISKASYDPTLLNGQWILGTESRYTDEPAFEYIKINTDGSLVMVSDFLGAWDNIKILKFTAFPLDGKNGFKAWRWESKSTSLRMNLVLSAWSFDEKGKGISLATGMLYLYNEVDGKLTLFNTVFRRYSSFTSFPDSMKQSFKEAINEVNR